jgi:hypothetical protein
MVARTLAKKSGATADYSLSQMSEVHLIFLPTPHSPLPTPYSLKPRTKVPHPNANRYIWLDCCHSGELLNILDEANPGKDGQALDRCFIAACRGFEVSREQLQGKHGILTGALLQGLEPDRDVDGFVTNYKLADFINKEMSAESQRPIFHNSGNAIILTDKMLGRQRQVDANLVGKCPYKALEYFTQEDAVFFYGRSNGKAGLMPSRLVRSLLRRRRLSVCLRSN